jgi:uncharacterized protein
LVYLDTSFLAPLAIPEDTSDLVERYLQRLEPGSLITSLGTRVELASLLSRRQRMGDFDGEQAERIRAAFDRVLGESLHLLVPTPEDFVTAADLLRDHAGGLRAGDALHLAVARNRGPMPILTLDRALVKAAKRRGIEVSTGIRLR